MKTLSLIILLASLLVTSARELQPGDVISWEPGSGKPRTTGRIVEVVRRPGRPTFLRVLEFGASLAEVKRENKPLLIAVTN